MANAYDCLLRMLSVGSEADAGGLRSSSSNAAASSGPPGRSGWKRYPTPKCVWM